MMWIIAVLLALFTTEVRSADFVTCQTSKERDGRYWSWRQVEGRKCWYPSRRRIDKSALRWVTNRPIYQQPRAAAVVTPHWIPALPLDDQTEQTITQLMQSMQPISMLEVQPWQETQEIERDDSILGEICCWPPLDNETNWTGIAALIGVLALAITGLAMTYVISQQGVRT